MVKDLAELVPPGEFNKDVFSDLCVCCECMRPVIESDIALKCDSCNLLVHTMCLDRAGIPAVNVDELTTPAVAKAASYDGSRWGHPPGIQPFTCVRCDTLNKSDRSVVLAKNPLQLHHTHCVLCLQIGVLLLPVSAEDEERTTSSAWAHPRCLWWLLATSTVSLTSPPPQQLKSISASYHFHPCAVCGSRQGCTVRCVRAGCDRRFHISCGFHAGCGFTVRTTGGHGCIVAGSRDAEDEIDVLENLKLIIDGKSGIRRTITCWQHEQRGTKRGLVQLGRTRPVVREICRWVPDGIRNAIVDVVNNVLSGEDIMSAAELKQQPATTAVIRRGRLAKKEEAAEESDYSEIQQKKKRKKKESTSTALSGITTVRMVDGEEVTCEAEDWEGACAQCGKAWVDSKGQILESICCDICDQWFHFACVGIDEAPSGDFACPSCKKK